MFLMTVDNVIYLTMLLYIELISKIIYPGKRSQGKKDNSKEGLIVEGEAVYDCFKQLKASLIFY